jgi:hypothetical protein
MLLDFIPFETKFARLVFKGIQTYCSPREHYARFGVAMTDKFTVSSACRKIFLRVFAVLPRAKPSWPN